MQITDHIHALKIPFQIPLPSGKKLDRFVYVYLITGPIVCLIDSGVKGTGGVISEYLRTLGQRPEDLEMLVLTHAHPDHIGSARPIKAATGCILAAHHDAKAWVEDVDLQFKERPVPGFHALVEGSASVDRFLQEGEIIELGPVSLKVIHTPGHAPGGISLFCREEKVLFSGDAVPRANDLPIYDDVATTVASIAKLKNIRSIEHLLASWSDPLAGSEAYKMMDDGLKYLQRIHGVIRNITAGSEVDEPMKLCAEAVKILGLPEAAVYPLIAKSFASHLQIIDRGNLYQ